MLTEVLSPPTTTLSDDFMAAGGRVCGLDELSEVPQTEKPSNLTSLLMVFAI